MRLRVTLVFACETTGKLPPGNLPVVTNPRRQPLFESLLLHRWLDNKPPGGDLSSPTGATLQNHRGLYTQATLHLTLTATRFAPVASPKPPLWQSLRAALQERENPSVRRAAKDLHAFDARQTEGSWKRTLNKALVEGGTYVFEDDTARVIAAFFGKPADYFVRPQQRETQADENRRLRAEIVELRRRLGEDEGSEGVQA